MPVNLDFPRIRKLKKVCSDVWLCTKMLNNAISKQNYIHTLLSAFKMAYLYCFSLVGYLDFLDFFQKRFYNNNLSDHSSMLSFESEIGLKYDCVTSTLFRRSVPVVLVIVKSTRCSCWRICSGYFTNARHEQCDQITRLLA